MEKAIKLAIEKGGYKLKGKSDFEFYHFNKDTNQILFRRSTGSAQVPYQMLTVSVNDLILDPLFWQALGKALGWSEIDFSVPHYYTADENYAGRKDCPLCHANEYFNLLLNHGDTEKFWKGLIK